jgi:hypothetical protein
MVLVPENDGKKQHSVVHYVIITFTIGICHFGYVPCLDKPEILG